MEVELNGGIDENVFKLVLVYLVSGLRLVFLKVDQA